MVLYQGTIVQLAEKLTVKPICAGFVTRARLQPGRKRNQINVGL
jgi:hypothetical protein